MVYPGATDPLQDILNNRISPVRLFGISPDQFNFACSPDRDFG
jgi:hypothetical protein